MHRADCFLSSRGDVVRSLSGREADFEMISRVTEVMVRPVHAVQRRSPSWNAVSRRRDMERVAENAKLVQRLIGVKSHYAAGNFLRSYEESRKHAAIASSARSGLSPCPSVQPSSCQKRTPNSIIGISRCRSTPLLPPFRDHERSSLWEESRDSQSTPMKPIRRAVSVSYLPQSPLDARL